MNTTTTTSTQPPLAPLKTQVDPLRSLWGRGRWVPYADSMVFLVDDTPRAFMPKEDFESFSDAAREAFDRHR